MQKEPELNKNLAIIHKDWIEISKGPLIGIVNEYDEQRKHQQVKKTESFCRCFELELENKHKWLIFLKKTSAHKRYKGINSIITVSVYYESYPDGIYAYKFDYSIWELTAYDPIFFAQFTQEMGLELETALDVVKHFFTYNGASITGYRKDIGTGVTLTLYRQGFTVGERFNEINFQVEHNFKNRESLDPDLQYTEKGIYRFLEAEIEKVLNSDEMNIIYYEYLTNIMRELFVYHILPQQ